MKGGEVFKGGSVPDYKREMCTLVPNPRETEEEERPEQTRNIHLPI